MTLHRITTFPAPTAGFSSIVFNDGCWFMTVGGSGVYTIYFSFDLITWTSTGDAAVSGATTQPAITPRKAGAYWFMRRVGAGIGLVKSTDLTTWTAVAGLPTGYADSTLGIACDGTTYVIVNGLIETDPLSTDYNKLQYLTSTNLTSWTLHNHPYLLGSCGAVERRDGKWFFAHNDGVSGSLNNLSSTPDLTTWTPIFVSSATGYYFTRDAVAMYAVNADTIHRYDDATHAFVSVAQPPSPFLYFFGAANAGSLLTLTDTGGGWSNFANAQQFTRAGWGTQSIGTPASPVSFAADLHDWQFGDTGVLFVSVNAGTIYLDFLGMGRGFEDWDILETGVGDDDLRLVTTSTPEDFGSASETVTPTAAVSLTVIEAVVADEVLDDSALPTLNEFAVAHEVLTPTSANTALLIDSAASADQEILGDTLTLIEVASATETLSFDSFSALIVERSAGAEVVTPTATRSITLAETGLAVEAVTPTAAAVLTDTAAAAETVTSSAAPTLIEAAVAADTLLPSAANADLLLVELAVATDLATVSIAAAALIDEAAVAADMPLTKDPGAIAWVLNPATSAASWYSNYSFTDLVQVGGVVLAVGPEGLCLLGASSDAGEAIDAAVTSGLQDFKSEQKKRVKEFRYSYTSDGRLALDVEVAGQTQVWTYALPKNPENLPRNGRVQPGQGLNSRYWRTTLRNVAGADFEIKSVTADLIIHTRRL